MLKCYRATIALPPRCRWWSSSRHVATTKVRGEHRVVAPTTQRRLGVGRGLRVGRRLGVAPALASDIVPVHEDFALVFVEVQLARGAERRGALGGAERAAERAAEGVATTTTTTTTS